MRGWIRDILLSLIMGVVVPAVVFHMGVHFRQEEVGTNVILEEQVLEKTQTLPAEIICESEPEETTIRLRRNTGAVVEMNLEEYLCGAVLAEMPASFEQEALKAQAVAARTYALRAIVTGGKHGDGSVCDQASCCQAYILPADYLENGGAKENAKKIRIAVEKTAGQVLIYEGNLIEATYFSCSGGRTEDAIAVWGVEYPYLKAVDSPGEEFALHFTDRVIFTVAELEERLGVAFKSDITRWFSEPSLTAGGGVDTITIAGKIFSGTQMRQLLGLRSTAFSVETDGMLVTVTTRGYGHRVGMSQYGAEAMALEGADFKQILAHYYPGTELLNWK